MNWWLIGMVIVVAIAIIWYVRQQAKAANQRQVDANTAEADRADNARPVKKSGGLLQEATNIASGQSYERAAGEIGEMTAELAQARRDAELAAARLSNQAGEALAAVQAAAAAHGGAVPGDGTRHCPPGYPIKGAMPEMRYHLSEQPSYERLIPDVCFPAAAAAEAAGYAAAGDEPGMRDGAGGVPPGAIRGDGSRDCPPTFPIKANQATRHYLEPSAPAYATTIPELCFSSLESVRAAGMSPAPR
ncbi:MAG: hypothetical protein M3Q50_01375 [Chloroflexota bacterium]|nr:hypothetical protein [Chloroflexota bacterium]